MRTSRRNLENLGLIAGNLNNTKYLKRFSNKIDLK
jgi:hypothetical protein